ncbi:MAG: diacylglycerol kinase family protein [Cyanobacterium sp. T60_A2020_053]|nr:diacylglycerol kinase family protein [Cyanobacterium sp. T60_A2020_053]
MGNLLKNKSSLDGVTGAELFPSSQSSHILPDYTPQGDRGSAWQIAPDLLSSFGYAWAGVRYGFKTQRNFRIHCLMAVVAIGFGFYLHATAVEMAVITLTCAMVMVLELLNTALESVVDLTVGKTYHHLAKIAKDCAAGAVLVSAICALLVASFILLPHGLNLIVSI